MQNVLLIVELILALALIGIVLLQRSEGAGGLGMQGGSITGRSAQTPLGKITWWLGLAFFAVAMALTIVEARESGNSSVLDRLGGSSAPAAPAEGDTPDLGIGTDLLPPKADASGTTAPAEGTAPAATTETAPATTPAAEVTPAPAPATNP